jgi:hypothetical protein
MNLFIFQNSNTNNQVDMIFYFLFFQMSISNTTWNVQKLILANNWKTF